jgi:hypothetical protein
VAKIERGEKAAVSILKKVKSSLYYLASYLLILGGYFYYIVPLYGYNGFEWAPDKVKILESIFLVIVLPLALPTFFKKPSDIFLHLQLLFPIVPMIVMYGAAGYPRFFLYSTIFSYVLMILIASHIRFKAVRVSRVSPLFFARILLGLSWGGILSIVLFGGLSYFNLDITKVYDFRTDAAANLPGIYGYISPLISKVLLPFTLLLAVFNKDKFLALAAIIGSIVMYGLTAHKGPLFYPFAVLVIHYILARRGVIEKLILGYLLIICISLVDFILGGAWIGNLMLRRVYLVPAYLNYMYYDYFSSHPYFFWEDSKITFGLVGSRYDLDSAHLVGLEYYGSKLAGANTGWIGSGYMNAGVLGVVLYSIIIGLLLAVLNGYGRSVDKRVVVAIIIAPVLDLLMSTDLPTAFLNHGIILSLVLFSMFSVQSRKQYAS